MKIIKTLLNRFRNDEKEITYTRRYICVQSSSDEGYGMSFNDKAKFIDNQIKRTHGIKRKRN